MDEKRGSVISADGTRIGFLTVGVGQPLLLIHGGMCSSTRWAPLWPMLARNFQVTMMDRRGRASSGDGEAYSLAAECGDVVAVAEHLAIQQGAPIDVFGHSYGAVCALGAAVQSLSLRRLALHEPPGPESVSLEWLDRVRVMISQNQPGRAMFSFLVEVVGLSPKEVETLSGRPGGYDPMPIVQRTMVREAEALTMVNLPALATEVTQPVLLLLGSESPPWAAAVTRGLADALSVAEVAVLDHQRHEAVDTAPELIAERLYQFLRESAPS